MGLTKVTYSMIQNAPINVQDFGALGNGIADDTAAISAAIDAIGTTGQTLFFPSGIYKISSTITVNPEAIVMVGEGNQPYRASQYASNAGVILFFTGAPGNPIFSFPTKTANVGQSAGHTISGLSLVGGHFEFNEYQTWNVIKDCSVLSRTWGWSFGYEVAESDLATLQAITNGSLTVTVDGTPLALTGLDLSTAITFDDVANIVDTAGRATSPYLRCQFTNGCFVIKAGTSTLDITSGSLVSAMKLGAATYQGSNMCSYGINLATTNFNTLVERCHFWDIDGNSIYIGDNNGNTAIYHCHFLNRAAGILEGVITTKHNMIVVKSTGANVVVSNCDFEPMIAASMVMFESCNTATIEKCYIELPDVAATDVTTFFEIGKDLGTGSFYDGRAISIENNFMNCKAKCSRAINLVACARGVWIRGNEILNFEYPLYVNTTANSIQDQVCYDGVQSKDTSGSYLISEIGGAGYRVDSRGSVFLAWTPVFEPASGSFTSVTYDANTAGVYTINGRLCSFFGFIGTDAYTVGTASGNLRIAGLLAPRASTPIIAALDNSSGGTINSAVDWGTNYPSSFTMAGTATPYFTLQYRAAANGATSPVQVSDLGSIGNDNFTSFNGCYITDNNV